MRKTIEYGLYIGDVAWFINKNNRSFAFDKIGKMEIDSKELLMYTLESSGLKYNSTEIGISLFVEKPKDYAGTVVVRKSLSKFIDKPLFDTFAKEWMLVSSLDEEYIVLVDSKGNRHSISMVGYGACWGLSEKEVG